VSSTNSKTPKFLERAGSTLNRDTLMKVRRNSIDESITNVVSKEISFDPNTKKNSEVVSSENRKDTSSPSPDPGKSQPETIREKTEPERESVETDFKKASEL